MSQFSIGPHRVAILDTASSSDSPSSALLTQMYSCPYMSLEGRYQPETRKTQTLRSAFFGFLGWWVVCGTIEIVPFQSAEERPQILRLHCTSLSMTARKLEEIFESRKFAHL
jgi:hypothetical protein